MPAKTIKNALDNNLALCICRHRSNCGNNLKSVSFILYDPEFIKFMAKKILDFNKESRPNGGSTYCIFERCNLAIYGKVEMSLVDSFYDTWECIREKMDFPYYKVDSSSCREKYGPLIYDIAMSYSDNKGLAPDLTLSHHARKIWRHYFNKRQDVVPYEIPERMKEKAYLSLPYKCSYVIKNKRKYEHLINNHNKFIRDIRGMNNLSKSYIEDSIKQNAEYFL